FQLPIIVYITSSFRLISLARLCLPIATVASSVRRMSIQAEFQGIPEGMQLVEEGKAKIAVPKDVFYNPVQVFNRDLTMAVLNVFGQQYLAELAGRREKRAQQQSEPPPEQQPDGLRILEALAATGLRSIRIAKEVPNVAKIVANDNSEEAVRLIKSNIVRNGVDELVEASLNDAVLLGHQCARLPPDERFDVVDLDPYGSAVPFLDSAVQAVRPGGLLCVTCTDTAVLCGSAFGTCYGRYGAVPYRGAGMHEASLRVLLQCVQSHASRHSRYIEPLLSLSVDFYVRIYLRVHRGQGEVKKIGRRLAMLHYCPECDSHWLQPMSDCGRDKAGQVLMRPARLLGVGSANGRCGQCGIGRLQLAGPMWSDSIHSVDFVRRLVDFVRRQRASTVGEIASETEQPGCFELASSDRLIGLLSVAAEELPDAPLFYTLDGLASEAQHTMPMKVARSALLNAGYRVSISHCEGNAIKTDAPASFLWDMVRAHYRQSGEQMSERHLGEGSLPKALLVDHPAAAGDGAASIDFSLHLHAEPPSKADGLLRFHKPPPNWGPKPRAKRKANGDGAASTAEANAATAAAQDDLTEDQNDNEFSGASCGEEESAKKYKESSSPS
uniref:tRNA (guanine(26)-N(2))-dimethyltransferase n=1 Tax=Macrostomum lignano TaxID=282301 RepID=A0A1I8G2D3_9PLAT